MAFWGLPLPPHLQLMWRRPSEGMLPISFLWHQLSRFPSPATGRYWRGPAIYSDSCKQCNVPVGPDQPCGLHCLAALFCSSSVDSPNMSVPVYSFSSLTPVHLVSPLQFSQFQAALADYPDKAAMAYILNGFRDSFRIGFEALSGSVKSASSNMQSAFHRASLIDAYFATEVSHGRVVGPFTSPPFTDLHITCFGVVPKRNLPEKWCLSLDLSSPDGHSVDDGIPNISFQSSTLQLTPVLVAS